MSFPVDRVAILGIGLMGGSLGGALRGLEGGPRVIGWTPDAGDRAVAGERGLVDAVADGPAAAIAEAELVVLAAPLGAVRGLLETHRDALSERVVTDLSSLKRPAIETASRRGLGAVFVGGHPLCGGEGSGAEAADPGLYEGARVYLCAGEAREPAQKTVEAFWRGVGAEPEWIEAGPHDRLMVRVSHLPQLLANVLAVELESAGIASGELGPGGHDMTRLAGSSPAMWLDLLEEADELPAALRDLSETLGDVADLLERSDMAAVRGLMERTARWRGVR